MNSDQFRKHVKTRAVDKNGSMESWYKRGSPVFEITDDVVFLLDNTRLPNPDCVMEIRLPFPELVLEFKYSGVVRTFFVTNLDFMSKNEVGLTKDGKVARWGGMTIFDVSSREFFDYIVRFWDGKAVLSLDPGLPGNNYPRLALPSVPGGVASVVVNAVALITSRPDEVAAKGMTAKHRYEPGTKIEWCQVKRWIVGKTISIPHGSNRHQASGKTYHLTSRFMVRGHWRLQAHGEARSERKIIWIMPFWKGPRNAEEALTRSYKTHGATHARVS